MHFAGVSLKHGQLQQTLTNRVPTLHSDQICRSTFLYRIPALHICCACVIAMTIATELPCYLQPPTTVCCTMRSKLSLFAQGANQLEPPVCWPTYWTYGHTHMVITLLLRIYLRLLKQILTQTHTVRNKQWFELGKHSIYIYIPFYITRQVFYHATVELLRHSGISSVENQSAPYFDLTCEPTTTSSNSWAIPKFALVDKICWRAPFFSCRWIASLWTTKKHRKTYSI